MPRLRFNLMQEFSADDLVDLDLKPNNLHYRYSNVYRVISAFSIKLGRELTDEELDSIDEDFVIGLLLDKTR